MNKRYWLVVQIVIALILMAVLLTGCEKNGVSSTSGFLTKITMAAAVDERGRPLHPTTVFATDADAFYCPFKVIDAPPETEIKGELTYVSGEVEAQIGKNYVMDELTITVEGTRYASVFYLRPPLPGYKWPKGDYKVVLYVNGKEDASIPFTVNDKEDASIPATVKDKETSSSGGIISNVTMAAAVDSNDRPLQPTSVFPVDTKVFYCSFNLSHFPPGARISLEWIYVGGEAVKEIGENTVLQVHTGTLGGDDGYTSIALQSPPDNPDYKWPKGDYKVVLSVDGEEKASASFKVE